jgi:hypothetical protein
MPANIRVSMANALAYYPGDVHDILSAPVDYTDPYFSTEPNDVSISKADMRGFIRAASEDGGAFRMIHDSQVGHIAEQINALDREDLTGNPTGKNDRALDVVGDAGAIMGTLDEVRADALVDERDRKTSENNWNKVYQYHVYGAPVTGLPVLGDTIQRLIDIGTGQHAEALNNAVSDKTKEELIGLYNKDGYPRLESMLNEQAKSLQIPPGDVASGGTRMGALSTAASNAYASGVGHTKSSAGEH